MFNNSVFCFYILDEQKLIFGNADADTGFIRVVGKCELRVCFMILEYLSLYGD